MKVLRLAWKSISCKLRALKNPRNGDYTLLSPENDKAKMPYCLDKLKENMFHSAAFSTAYLYFCFCYSKYGTDRPWSAAVLSHFNVFKAFNPTIFSTTLSNGYKRNCIARTSLWQTDEFQELWKSCRKIRKFMSLTVLETKTIESFT